MLKLWNYIKNNNGFTLIEAIITVAIVGIIVVPISLVFTGSLKNAYDARQQLNANEIAQLFVENLKSKSESDLVAFCNETANSKTITRASYGLGNVDNAFLSGFPAIPEGYTVVVSYDRTTLSTIPSNGLGTFVPEATGYDCTVTLQNPTTLNNSYSVTNEDGDADTSDTITFTGTASGVNRIFYITYESDGNHFWIEDYSRAVKTQFPTVSSTGTHTIKINCLGSEAHGFDTTINVTNKSLTPLELYVYEKADNNVNPTIVRLDGSVSVISNMVAATDTSSQRVIVVQAKVINNANSRVIADLKATKLDE